MRIALLASRAWGNRTTATSGPTPVETGNAKTNEDNSPVNTRVLVVLASHSRHTRQCRMYRLFQPTFIPRHRLQNAKGCIRTSRIWRLWVEGRVRKAQQASD